MEFHLGTTVTTDLIEEEMPDTVVIATGARFRPDKIPGSDGKNVVNVLDVLEGKAELGDKVVIWGGKKPGIAAALHLSKKGKKVTLISQERKVGKDVNPSFVWRYIKYLHDSKVRVYKNSTLEEINDKDVVVRSLHNTKIPVAADTVIFAEREPVVDLKEFAKGQGLEVHVIGDALVPRTMSNALHDGYRTGIRI